MAFSLMKQSGHNLLKSGMIFSGITFLSRILGFIRDMVTANLLGAASDIFIFAQRIPNLFRRMFAEGSFSQAFVPIIAKHHSDNDNEEMKRMLASAAGWLSVITLTISILGVVFSSYITMALANGWYHDYIAGSSHKYEYASILLKVTFPYIFFVSLVALSGALYNVIGRVAVFSFTPCILNLAIIFSALVFPRYFGYDVNLSLCLGVFFGGVAQLAFQIPYLKKIGFLVVPRLELTPSIRKMFKNMVRALIGASGYQLNMLVNTIVASFLISGSLSWLYYAERLLELPLGIFGVAIATILLPTLSRKVKQYQDNPNQTTKQNFTNAMNWGVTTSIIVAFPATICMITLGKHIIDLLFHHGQFNLDDLNNTYLALLAFSFSVAPSMLVKTFNNAFYAHENTKVPMRVSLFTIGCNILLNLFALHFGFWFLALSTSFCVTLNALIVYFILRHRDVYRFNKDTWITIGRVFIASIALTITLLYLPASIRDYIQLGNISKILHLAFYGIVGGIVYLAVLFALGFRLHHVKYRETLPSHDSDEDQAEQGLVPDSAPASEVSVAAPTPASKKSRKQRNKEHLAQLAAMPEPQPALAPNPIAKVADEKLTTEATNDSLTPETSLSEPVSALETNQEAPSYIEDSKSEVLTTVSQSETKSETKSLVAAEEITQVEGTEQPLSVAQARRIDKAKEKTKDRTKKAKKSRKEARDSKAKSSSINPQSSPVISSDSRDATHSVAKSNELEINEDKDLVAMLELPTAQPAVPAQAEQEVSTSTSDVTSEPAIAHPTSTTEKLEPDNQTQVTDSEVMSSSYALDNDAYNATKAKLSQEIHRNQLKTADSLGDTSKVETTTTISYSRGYSNGHEPYKQQTIKQESSISEDVGSEPEISPAETFTGMSQTSLYENKLQAQNAKQTTALLEAQPTTIEQSVTKPQSYSAATLLAGKPLENIVPPKPQRNVQIVSDSSLLTQSSSALDQMSQASRLVTVPHDQGTLALNSERLISHPDQTITTNPGVRSQAHVEISFTPEYTESDLIRMQEKHAQRLKHPEDEELNAIPRSQPTFRQTTTILPPAVLMGDQRNNIVSQNRQQQQISVKSEVDPYLRKHPTIPTPIMEEQVVQNALAAQCNLAFPFQQNLQRITPIESDTLNQHELTAHASLDSSGNKRKSNKAFPPRLRNVGVVSHLNESKPIAAPVVSSVSLPQPEFARPVATENNEVEFDFGEWEASDLGTVKEASFAAHETSEPSSAKEHYQQLSQQSKTGNDNAAPAPHDLYALVDDVELEKLRGQEPERYRLAKALLSTVKKTELVKALNPEEKDNPERILDAELWNLILGKKQSELQAIAEKQLSADDWDNAMRRELSLEAEAHVTTLNQSLPEGVTTGQTQFDKSKLTGSKR